MSETAEYWNERYTKGSTPWDTGITPPEVVTFWANHRSCFEANDVVLDLGCGTLTNLQFLADQSLCAFGLDASFVALRRGGKKLERCKAEGRCVGAVVGDVSHLPYKSQLARYILDLGCLHTLDWPQRSEYVAELTRILVPKGYLHLFCFQRVSSEQPAPTERRFFYPGELDKLFAERYDVISEDIDEEAEEGRVGVWRLMQLR